MTGVDGEIADFGARLDRLGMCPGTSGNVSALVGGRILITPTGALLGALDPERLSVLDLDGGHLAGPRPTKEALLHAAVYRARPEAAAIVHLHSPWALAVSCLGDLPRHDALAAYTPYYAMRVGALPRVPYFPPGDAALARACAAAFEADGRARAVLLDRHGLVAIGATVGDASAVAEEVELAARMHFLLEGRSAAPLSEDERAALA